MKTIKKWLSELPYPYNEMALDNLNPNRATWKEKSLSRAIMNGFFWATDVEMATFWEAVFTDAKHIESIEQQKESPTVA